ncbi:hydantoinase B/oxoprolinase family protein [Enterovirga rhinocerotis]|uniref:N-methylhydantoinase B n=1 Tax=Enterovirga rhinocerotis TaxID=1339210 RepID=A0A4R7C6U0_9HYPH|nr:hydantoinase B/oxoprolinase family protein [Enterovirga rhinocerotis]TDR92955.1 N-methylhydantoinase B [Enterovirga rhinocerotis]
MTSKTSNARFDSVDVGIIWSRLVSVADEMVSALVRTSFSTMVRESGDFSVMLFDGRGKFLAQGAVGVPSFTGTGPSTVQGILELIPPESLRDGDVVITNDPWIGTGHVYDINMLKPIFFKDRIVGYCLTVSHLADVGGGPGYGADARDVYEEGFSLPPIRLYEQGVPNAFVIDFFKRNVRFAELVLGDIYSNVASCNVGAQGLLDILVEYDLDDIAEVADEIFALTRAAITERLLTIPTGTFAATLPVEGVDGLPEITLAVKITVARDGFRYDFEGTGPTVGRGVNVPICYTRAYCYFCFKVLVAPAIPNNQAVLDFVTLSAPDNCILNALRPNPTGARHIFGHYVAPLVFGALAEALPGEVQADSGMIFQVNLRGRSQLGRDYSYIYFTPGGYGAFGDMDGRSALPGPSNMIGGSVEVWEEDTGCFFLRKEVLPNSGGAGEFQGGNGQVFALRNDTGRPVDGAFMASRTRLAARGFRGGRPGAHRRIWVDGIELDAKARVTLAPGGVISVEDSGGGGFGDPAARDPNRIRSDLQQGLVTRDWVVEHYPDQASSIFAG